MRILIYDTETTGFPSDKERILQFAAHIMVLSTDHPPLCVQEFSTLVQSDVAPHEKALAVHGITQEHALYGITEEQLCRWFAGQVTKSDMIVAHNLDFDAKFMSYALKRNKVPLVHDATSYCTMKESTGHVRVPPTPKMRAVGRLGYKSPSLAEAYGYFTGKTLVGAHDALVDVRACKDVLLGLLSLNDLYNYKMK